MWDLLFIFGVNIPWFTDTFNTVLQRIICMTFIALSGFCTSLGRHKLKRGLTVFAASGIITAATAIFMPQNIIIFGVLTLIGTAMLLMIPLEGLLRKINPYAGAIGSIFLYVFTQNINFRVIGVGSFSARLPLWLYKNYFTAFWGFPQWDFFSVDYYPVFPWIFIFLFGFFLFGIFEKLKLLRFLSAPRIKPAEWIGRNALILYMLHQPLVYGVLYVLFSIIR